MVVAVGSACRPGLENKLKGRSFEWKSRKIIWPIEVTDDEIIQMMREHFESLFPRVCPKCNRRFATLSDYIKETKPVGPAIPYDAEMRNWKPSEPIGGVAFSQCPCGHTIALSTEGMTLSRIHLVLDWIKRETELRKITPRELVDYLRAEVRKRVLSSPGE